MLTNQAYQEIGRLQGSLSRHADEVYCEIGDEHQRKLVQAIFLELVHLGEGAQDTSRRVRKRDLLSLASPGEIEPLLMKLAASRLVSVGCEGTETFVEVSHEALIREWPALREWLTRNREELQLERRLMHAAQEWERFDRETGALLRGARLFQAEELLARHEAAPALLREFVQASIQQRLDLERKRDETQLRILAEEQARLRLAAETAEAIAALEKKRCMSERIRRKQRRQSMIAFLAAALIFAGAAASVDIVAFPLAALICAGFAGSVAWLEHRASGRSEPVTPEISTKPRIYSRQG
jgi:hypothetical protein